MITSADALRRAYVRLRSRALRTLLSSLLPVRPRADLVRLGSAYGGWTVPSAMLTPGSICYSAGLGEDGSFDQELAKRYRCQVFVFDPTPRSIEYARRELVSVDGIRFEPIGLWSEAASLRFYAPRNPRHVSHSIVNLQRTEEWFDGPCKSVRALMDELGHDRISLLKLDIEGAEYAVLDTVIRDRIDVGVVCVEFDQPMPVKQTVRQVRALRRAGFELVAQEGWNFTFVREDCRE